MRIPRPALALFNSVDFPFMLTNNGEQPGKLAFSGGLYQSPEGMKFYFFNYAEYSECSLVPLFSLASKENIPVEVWSELADHHDGCLFENTFSLLLADLDGRQGLKGVDPVARLTRTVAGQIPACREAGLPLDTYGLSACEVPGGQYKALHASFIPVPVLAPPSVFLTMPWTPSEASRCLAMLQESGMQRTRYGLPCSVEFSEGKAVWHAERALGVDIIPQVLAADAMTDKIVHRLTARNEVFRTLLTRAGFGAPRLASGQ